MNLKFSDFEKKVPLLANFPKGIDLVLRFSKDYASEKTNHRQKIREDILSFLEAQESIPLSEKIRTQILDLNSLPPRVGTWFFSISHCRAGGVWMAASAPVGIDFEEVSRLLSKTVERVSSKEEIQEVQKSLESRMSWLSLWCAKESAYKAYSSSGSLVSAISSFQVKFDSRPQDSQVEKFKISALKSAEVASGEGRLFAVEDCFFAAFILTH